MFGLKNILKTKNITKLRNIRNINCATKITSCECHILLPLATNLFCKKLKHINVNSINLRLNSSTQEELIDPNTFEKVSEDTLESLTDYFEELVENDPNLKDADISYSSGVLTIALGRSYGTYVINKQSPNRQIWLSSPTSGPKRYDFITSGEYWVYKHTGETLHSLLQNEISKIINANINFLKCSYSKI